MAEEMDKGFWESHWNQTDASESTMELNPHLQRETGGLPPGTAPDAGHEHDVQGADHGALPFDEASVSVASVVALFDEPVWDVVTAEERSRTLRGMPLRDVVIRAIRR